MDPSEDLSDLGGVPVAAPGQIVLPAPSTPTAPNPSEDLSDLGGKPVLPTALQQEWANASPWERLKMMGQHVIPTAEQVVPPIAAGVADQALKTVGTAAGATVGSLADPFTGPLGTMTGTALGDYYSQKLAMALGLQDKVDPGEVMGSAIMGAGKGPITASVAGLLGTQAHSMVDTGKPAGFLPSTMAAFGGYAASAEKTPNQMFEDARAAGYVMSPTQQNQSFTNRVLGSIAGDANQKAESSIKNQANTNRLGAEEIGVPDLTPPNIAAAWQKANAPLEALKQQGPYFATLVDELRQARYDADNAEYQYNSSQPGVSLKKNPAMAKQAAAARGVAQAAEAHLAQASRVFGVQDIFADYVANRPLQAKIGMIEKNVDANGNLSAKALKQAQDNGVPLTGNLKTIADTYANFKPFMRDGPDVTVPGSNKLNAFAAADLAARGWHLAGPIGAAAAVTPFLDKPVRSFLLSDIGQSWFNTPPQPAPGLAGNLARFGAFGVAADANDQSR